MVHDARRGWLLGLVKSVTKLNANRLNEIAAMDFEFAMNEESVSEEAYA
jgi:hypothetical protein